MSTPEVKSETVTIPLRDYEMLIRASQLVMSFKMANEYNHGHLVQASSAWSKEWEGRYA